MASGILENDNLLVVGQRAWHGMGTVLDNPPTSADAIRIAHLDWQVEQKPIYAEGGVLIPNYFANVRTDTNESLGIVTNKYKICQNTEAFDFVDDIMGQKDIPVKYESCGSLFNGRKIWLLARLEDRMVLGDKTECYMCFENSHDGKGAIKIFGTSVRVVCNNTLQLAVSGATRMWSAKHYGNIELRKREAIETLGLANDYFNRIDGRAEELYVIRPNWDMFLDKLLPIDSSKSERVQSNTILVRNSISKIYTEKDDLQNFKGTGWGMYNAVADYVSNADPLRNAPTWKENKMQQHMIGEVSLLKKAELLLVA